MSGIKHFVNRILLTGGVENVHITTDSPVRTQEQLENSVTYVAEFNVIEESTALSSNDPVHIDQIDRMIDDGDGYLTKRMFTGVINHIDGESYPNKSAVTCTGSLALLRLTRPTDKDFSGYTDGEAVRWILTRCGITYDADDISDYGYELGQIKPVVWQKGTPASQFVQELDRVFGMATIEIGTGRVVRIPYSRVPYDYDSGDVLYQFRRGVDTTEYYEGGRGRGDIEAIQNYWRITGLSYEGEEDTADEGCTFTYWAESSADHAKLGNDVFIGPNEFSSDIIQSEALAKQIARRMMRWYNREPDTIRVTTLNRPQINVGDLIAVYDPAWGMDLPGTKRYLVLNITRDGDDMTIDGIGGTAGAAGTITGGIERCCGTQQDDGTCVETGTDPSEGDTPDPITPPDSPTGHCDPLTDTTCIPGEDYEIPPDPNVEDPYINCTESGEGVDLINSPWRESGDIEWRYDADTDETLGVYTMMNGTLTYNITAPPTPKTGFNDVLFAGCEVVCVSGTVRFCSNGADTSNHELIIELFPALDSLFGGWAQARFASQDFLAGYPTPELFGGSASLEGSGAHFDPRAPMYHCAADLVSSGTDGGYMGASPGYGTDAAFSVCFDLCNSPPQVTYGGSWGSGKKLPLHCPCRPALEPGVPCPVDDDYAHCTHDHHILQINLGHPLDSDEFTDIMCPKVELTSLNIGFGTCEENPDYVDPFEEI